jgi:hypothetical protein
MKKALRHQVCGGSTISPLSIWPACGKNLRYAQQPKAARGVCVWTENRMSDSDDLLERFRGQADEMLAVAAKTPCPIVHINLSKAKGSGRLRYWSSRVPDRMDNVAREHHRAVYGTGANTRYKLFNSEKEARGSAAEAMRNGAVSQVAVEENKSGEWVLSETPGHRA